MDTQSDTQPRCLTLEQFCAQIKYVVEQSQLEAWVTAEIAQVNISRGHYYIDLIQKSDYSDMPSAKLKCNIWAGMVNDVLKPFRDASGGDIEAGMKVLVYIRTTFHTVYGLSGIILGIDPNYTLGDLEARRRAIWEMLQSEGVTEMNKALPLPTVIQHVAVISARTAAGFGDFMNQLANNAYGIDFRTELFESTVQGAEADASIVSALERVAMRADEFDTVVMIRGGGSKMDLACFDSYNVATNIAQFPLPVITGIGHERDRSIADMVANTSVKTPTAVAEFIIAHDTDFLVLIDDLERRVLMASANQITANTALMDNLSIRLQSAIKECLNAHRTLIDNARSRIILSANMRLANARQALTADEMRVAMAAGRQVERNTTFLSHATERLTSAANRIIDSQRTALDAYAQRVKSADPRAILARGFTVTTDANGRPITSATQARTGDNITTFFADGKITSTVQ